PPLRIDDGDLVAARIAFRHVERDVAAVPREVRLRAADAGVDDLLAIGQVADDDLAAHEGGDAPAVLREERPRADANPRAGRHRLRRQHALVALEEVVVAVDRQHQIAAVADAPAVIVPELRRRDVPDDRAGVVVADGDAIQPVLAAAEDHAAAVDRPVGVDSGLTEDHRAGPKIDHRDGALDTATHGTVSGFRRIRERAAVWR